MSIATFMRSVASRSQLSAFEGQAGGFLREGVQRSVPRPSWRTTMKPYRSLMRRPGWLFALYLLLILARAYGLDPDRRISQYGHTVWRTQDGLVNATSAITQTTDG